MKNTPHPNRGATDFVYSKAFHMVGGEVRSDDLVQTIRNLPNIYLNAIFVEIKRHLELLLIHN